MKPSNKRRRGAKRTGEAEATMAATEAPEQETTDEAKEPRPETTFRVFVRPRGGDVWTLLDQTVDGRTQDEGKKRAARMLNDIPEYAAQIQGDGLELAVTSARSFKPAVIKVEPQPAKVVIR
jgi:hypothetical protein